MYVGEREEMSRQMNEIPILYTLFQGIVDSKTSQIGGVGKVGFESMRCMECEDVVMDDPITFSLYQ